MTLDDLSDRLNPVFIKESRQVFHNKIVLVTLSLLLLAELAMHLIIMVNYSSMRESTLEELGKISFVIQQVMIGIAILVICVFRAGNTFVQERSVIELDYSRISVITPHRILMGKVLSQLLIMVDIYTIAMPFMFIAYFLRGISIPQMVGWSLVVFPIYILLLLYSLFAASFGKKGVNGGGLALLFFFGQGIIPLFIAAFLDSGDEMLAWAICYGVVFVYVTLLFYTLTIAVINNFGNRMYGFRLQAGCQFLLLTLLAILFDYDGVVSLFTKLTPVSSIRRFPMDGEVTNMSVNLILLLLIINCLVTLMERVEPGKRVLAERPKSKIRRLLRFVFSSGRASGLFFQWLSLIGIGGVLAVLFLPRLDEFFETNEYKLIVSEYAVAIYLLFYLQFALMLTRMFKKLKAEYAGIFTFLVFFALPLLFVAVLTFDRANFYDYWGLLLTTPLWLGRNCENVLGVVIVGVALCLLTAFPLLKFVYSSMKTFVFADEKEVEG